LFTLAAVGTTFYALQNSTQLGSVTDASYSAGGAALIVYEFGANNRAKVSLFAAGRASTAVPPPPLPNFNSVRGRKNFPGTGLPGDLWLDTETGGLFLAVQDPNEFLPGQTDSQNTTNVHREQLAIRRGPIAALPSALPVGTIFLCTDTLQAFAGTGPGVQLFRLDVGRALRGPDSAAAPAGSTSPAPIFFVPLN
jgi:hypothetical protein